MLGYTEQYNNHATVREYVAALDNTDEATTKRIERANPSLSPMFKSIRSRWELLGTKSTYRDGYGKLHQEIFTTAKLINSI